MLPNLPALIPSSKASSQPPHHNPYPKSNPQPSLMMDPSQLIHHVQKWRLSFRVLGSYNGRKIKFHISNGFRPFSPCLVHMSTGLQTYRLNDLSLVILPGVSWSLPCQLARQSYVALHPLVYIGIFTGVYWCQRISTYSQGAVAMPIPMEQPTLSQDQICQSIDSQQSK